MIVSLCVWLAILAEAVCARGHGTLGFAGFPLGRMTQGVSHSGRERSR
jgi:hypothetical protein